MTLQEFYEQLDEENNKQPIYITDLRNFKLVFELIEETEKLITHRIIEINTIQINNNEKRIYIK